MEEKERKREQQHVYAPQNRNGTARRGVCYFIIDTLSPDTERAKSIRRECTLSMHRRVNTLLPGIYIKHADRHE